MIQKTTFYTCCDKKYEDFIPIFLHSILFHNVNLDVEIGVEDINISQDILKSVDYITEKYPDSKIKIKTVPFNKIKIGDNFYNACPNVIRFITPPEIENEYVYISDIDIITLQDNIQEIHIMDMEKTGLNYSNIVRPNTKRLSGLHFTKWNNYYPISDLEELSKRNLLSDDELFLYQLVEKKNNILVSNTFRPVHGIHISPNRISYSTTDPDWGFGNWKSQWIRYRNSDEFLFLEKLFTKRINECIEKIDKYFMSAETIFTKIYTYNLWNGTETKSGPGSDIEKNIKLLKLLEDFVKYNNIKTILDIGCGEFNWMKMFDFNLIEKYKGVDVVEKIITENIKKFNFDNVTFEYRDIINYEIEKYDLIICKDVLVHLTYQETLKIISNIKKSKSRYFMSTSFLDFVNRDINTGQWRPINLVNEPFNLGAPILYYPNIEDYKEEWTNKGIGIWEI